MIRLAVRHISLMVSGLLVLLGGLASCKPSVPSQYIQPDDMEDILYDYHVAQALSEKVSDHKTANYNKNLFFHVVLRKHGVTEAEFDSSLVYYYYRADRFMDIYANVSDRLNKKAMSLGTSAGEISKYSHYKTDGDTANIWNFATSTVLLPHVPYNRFDFTLEADTAYRKGDSFLFNFEALFKYQSGSKTAVALMAVTYDNDSVAWFTNHVMSTGFTQMRIPPCDTLGIRKLAGFIYLVDSENQSNQTRWLFVNNIQLIRMHSKRPEPVPEEQPKDSLPSGAPPVAETRKGT